MESKVAFLDDNNELRNLLVNLIETAIHVKCLGLGNFEEFIQHQNEVLKTQVAILDIELGANQPSGVDAYNTLTANGYKGKVFFLTGHGKAHPLVQKAALSGAVIWEKPMRASSIISTLKQTLAPSMSEKSAQV